MARALLPLGEPAVRRGQEVLARLELIRISDRILAAARQLGGDLAPLITYDERLRTAAAATGCPVAAPR